MTDIVERSKRCPAVCDCDGEPCLLFELRAEIERLRAADKVRVTVHEAEIRRLAIECGQAKDEIERLRAAGWAVVNTSHGAGAEHWAACDGMRHALENKP